MKYLPIIARYLLGLIFLVFGLNKFLGFLPAPEMSDGAGAFFGALFATGYMVQVIGAVETLAGIAFLANKFVPLALVLLAPITLNIFLFHAFLDPASGPVGFLAFALNIYLFFAYKKYYDPMLVSSATLESEDSE